MKFCEEFGGLKAKDLDNKKIKGAFNMVKLLICLFFE